MIRWRRPTVTASSFECTCSFIMMFCTCVRSVFREMDKLSQTAGVARPSASDWRTWSSRAVSA